MELLEFADAAAWDAWLGTHPDAGEAWLRIGRAGRGAPFLPIGDALEVALCHGWIDGHRKGLDDVSFRQRYSPRRRGSAWSAVNVAKAEALIAAGRMRAGGLAEIEAARADGRWAGAYASQATAEVPSELLTALAADPRAASAFAALGRTEQYRVLLPVLKARTPAARQARVAGAVAQLARPVR
ncbi:YdeI/OmpD-associated family protein [Pseudonocardia sp. CA-107938]|uniref:YdeI/OmpD-associated family protein n=1 Tax=Pseudonocardia sp. CA-107938 TaxID=3240021 RepID=UPI003D925492